MEGEDLSGIDHEVAVHTLNISPVAKTVKQRKRRFASKRQEVIREEIDKLFNVSFIREVQYLDWPANVVLVKKANAEKDREETSFITKSAIYCYEVMPFGLKNVRTTYQRLVNKVFANLVGKNIEAYVYDMVVKSKQVDRNISDLNEINASSNIRGGRGSIWFWF
ncbi:uncharacterized protein LOC111404378 [Olea europaea var. sylvestris]|uniref:uncharacterized protein LOC111404378 n=1 Tax=Olea europaea var. sylvestris TaxID=158386 RepID=UPI000C1D1C79|nr:uncharacterized protein LOC111404378 [Olea europaea var. sylvestris]